MQTHAENRPKDPSSNLSVWAAVLVAVVGLAYCGSLSGPFVHDDVLNISENPGIRHVFPLFGEEAYGRGTGLAGRPVARLSFALNYALAGTSVAGYHIVNLLIHLAAVLLLFELVRLTLSRSPVLSGRYGESAVPLAFFSALLWGVHPLNTQAVTYVVQRCESLAGLFFMATLYAGARAAFDDKPLRWNILGVAAFFLGLGTKEILVTAPAVLAAYHHLFAPRPFLASLRRSALLYLAFAAGAAILAANMALAARAVRIMGFKTDVTRWDYARTQPIVIARYLRLAVFPKGLCFDYWWLPEKGWRFVPYAAALAAAFLATLYGLVKKHPLSFAGICFFAILGPSSSLVPLNTVAAEHRMYLPLAALAAAVVTGAGLLAARRGEQPFLVFLAVAGLACLVLAGATFARNRDYRSAYALWSDTARKRPENPRAQDALGVAVMEQGDLPRAEGLFKRAIEIDNRYAPGHFNMGNAMFVQNRVRDAIRYYRRAVLVDPDFWRAYANLGAALCAAGLWDEGVWSLEKALKLYPGSPEVAANLQRARESRLKAQEKERGVFSSGPDSGGVHMAPAPAARETEAPNGAPAEALGETP